MTESTFTQQFQSIVPSLQSIFHCSETEAKAKLDPVFESLRILETRHFHVANPSELQSAATTKRSILSPLVRFLLVTCDTDSTSEHLQEAKQQFMEVLSSIPDGTPFAITDPNSQDTKWYVLDDVDRNGQDVSVHSDLQEAKHALETTHCQ